MRSTHSNPRRPPGSRWRRSRGCCCSRWSAPAIGAAVLILVATALDALGVPLGTTAGAIVASALAGGGGYLVRFVLERRTGTGSAPEVQEQPAE